MSAEGKRFLDQVVFLQAMPYTGGSILHRMHYADSGAVQTYGSMVQTCVALCDRVASISTTAAHYTAGY